MASGNGRRAVAEAEPVAEPVMAGTQRLLGMEADEYDALMAEHQVSMLQERIAELEFSAEDSGWERIDGETSDLDLDKSHLRKVIRDAQTMYLANPLINHAVDVIAVYVFGQGVSISGQGIANDRVQAFLSDRGNQRTLTGMAAMLGADRALTYEGNRFYALFSKTGEVTRVRSVPTFQMVAGDIIRNPDDDAEVWFYARRWKRKGRDAAGRATTEERTDYYPDLHYQPETKPDRYGEGQENGEVHWDAPMIHVKDGGLTGARYGVPTIYASLTWARAVSRDLSDYATVKRALARFAWKFTTKTRAGAASVRSRLATTVSSTDARESNPPPMTGSAAVMTEGNDLEPLKTAGSQPNPEEGRRLGLMVAAGVGVPETILFGNADAGNLATAKTLDRPTELMMSARQSLWADVLTDIVAFDLRRAADEGAIPEEEPDPDAPIPPPDEAAMLDTATGTVVTPPQVMRPVELTPDVVFTDILEDDVTARIAAIVQAATLGASGTRANTMPDDLLTNLLLTALGVEDIDEVIDRMFPPEGAIDPLGAIALDEPDPLTAPLPETQFREAVDAFARALTGPGGSPRLAAPVRRGRARRPWKATPTH